MNLLDELRLALQPAKDAFRADIEQHKALAGVPG